MSFTIIIIFSFFFFFQAEDGIRDVAVTGVQTCALPIYLAVLRVNRCRGGSDTTAVAMAAAINAEYCEICSDVDGVYTADPRVVSEARRIAALSYEETQEMAESGAKVLNAQAVEFAKEKGIAIYARATNGPLPGADPSADGTVVRRNPPRMPGTVVGVASERDVLTLESDAPPHDLLSALDTHQVAGKQLHIVADRTNLIISRENLHSERKVREALTTQFGD